MEQQRRAQREIEAAQDEMDAADALIVSLREVRKYNAAINFGTGGNKPPLTHRRRQ